MDRLDCRFHLPDNVSGWSRGVMGLGHWESERGMWMSLDVPGLFCCKESLKNKWISVWLVYWDFLILGSSKLLDTLFQGLVSFNKRIKSLFNFCKSKFVIHLFNCMFVSMSVGGGSGFSWTERRGSTQKKKGWDPLLEHNLFCYIEKENCFVMHFFCTLVLNCMVTLQLSRHVGVL